MKKHANMESMQVDSGGSTSLAALFGKSPKILSGKSAKILAFNKSM